MVSGEIDRERREERGEKERERKRGKREQREELERGEWADSTHVMLVFIDFYENI